MKITLNKTNRGFTLIEMIGVLAVIAILAAVLIPKVFEAINSSRISNAAITCNTVKTAVADHYAKFGTLPVDGSTATPTPILATALPALYDEVLVREGFLDKPFAVKIGDGIRAVGSTCARIVAAAAVDTAPDGANAAYNLDGTTTGVNINKAAGSHVIEAVITGVMPEDARALDKLIDGPALSGDGTDSAATGTYNANLVGRVKYAAPGAAGTTTVHVYLTHR